MLVIESVVALSIITGMFQMLIQKTTGWSCLLFNFFFLSARSMTLYFSSLQSGICEHLPDFRGDKEV